MPQRPHLLFRNPVEGVVEYRPLPRAVFPQDDDEDLADYTRMRENFRTYRKQLIEQRDLRHNARTIEIPQHIDYIEIHFFGPFDYEKFSNHYRTIFGLAPVKFEKFNTIVLFAVINEARFSVFLEQLLIFINTENHTGELPYNVNIRYIKEFHLLSNERIIDYDTLYNNALLNLVESEELLIEIILPIEERLQVHLRTQNLTFSYNPTNRTIQIWDVSSEGINAILSNFDIVHSVNSSLSGIVRPGAFATPIREFGFTITPPEETAPSIGILDTGVSEQTPLSTIILNRNTEYDLIGSGSRIDNYDNFRGHGTAVAGFAALGDKLIPDHSGTKIADAWIVAIKIYQDGRPRVADTNILETIRDVHRDKGTKIFVLTISEQSFKNTDDSVSAFAYSLDLLAYELNILIFISAGNVHTDYFFDPVTGAAIHHYPNDFAQEFTNIKSPAESMNNFTTGACASNFETGVTAGIAIDGTFPAIYTSKFHYNYHDGLLNRTQRNKHLKKPDAIYNGGDWDNAGNPSVVGLKHISGRTGEFFSKNTGTSFSAPLMANLAVRISKNYPELRMQSIKALIINSAEPPPLSTFFDELPRAITTQILGYGIPNQIECIFSDDNSVTMILEDEILPDKIKSFDLNIPEYLLMKENASTVLEVKMTMCFSFEPILNNQMAYCPIHIGFGLFKNLPLHATRSVPDEDGVEVIESIGLTRNTSEKIRIKSGQSWSEDYYFKMKLLSNTQKLELVYSKEDIRNNQNKFKIALNCLRHKLLSPGQRDHYNSPHKFSLAINIKEKAHHGILSGNLYNELDAINTLVAVADLEAEAES
jgi:Subtilase family